VTFYSSPPSNAKPESPSPRPHTSHRRTMKPSPYAITWLVITTALSIPPDCLQAQPTATATDSAAAALAAQRLPPALCGQAPTLLSQPKLGCHLRDAPKPHVVLERRPLSPRQQPSRELAPQSCTPHGHAACLGFQGHHPVQLQQARNPRELGRFHRVRHPHLEHHFPCRVHRQSRLHLLTKE